VRGARCVWCAVETSFKAERGGGKIGGQYSFGGEVGGEVGGQFFFGVKSA
jgi:hypothetical protein